MIDKVLGHYRIVAKLGEGGMGVVYRARDQVLQRDVALKFLGGTLAREAREFLLREARAVSALSHPNICTVHEVGEAGGEFYIVMELIEGKPLSVSIGSGGLPYESVMRYGAQIAGALAHAHGRNIVHRDLKSSNVMVTPEGLVKVLDFGLARRLAVDAHDAGTRTMDTLESAVTTGGTLPYMSPEILRGDPGDNRSDLWALGVVLYEATAGQVPFQGRTSFEVTSAILREPPPPLPARLPPGLAAVIQRCLTKDPVLRYQRATEVQAALEAVQSATAVVSEPIDQRGRTTTVHRGVKHLMVKNGDVVLLVGTMKGVFLLRSSAQRARWDIAGPYFHGQSTYALAYDSREGRHRLWASTVGMWGAFLRSSDDFGRTWTNPQEAPIRFPADSGAVLKNIWHICLGRPADPDVMYCGVEPAALYESRDDGETWSLVRGLFDHPHRPRWMPGFGGLALHTVVLDPQNPERMYVAISAGGVYVTEDGGRTWQARNRGIRVVHMPEKYPEFGQCIHKIAMHPARPERLFVQNHWGLYRTDNHGESWQDIAHNVPSDFGFAMVTHPRDPDCVYIVPIESDEFRCTPEGCLRVYRTRNAGESWEPLSRGLPQKGAFETVLRDAMTTDSLDPAGIYFGTRSGQLYGSADEGKTWKKILDGLPPVVCVKSGVIGEPRSSRAPRKTQKKASPKRRPPGGKSKVRRKR
ncbi:MAG TPA: protein kinase [Bryobacteraceae bacterium]|nr:protein kinase [Bryobacteraceae bacterium]